MGGQRALSYYSQDAESITNSLGLFFLKEIRKHDWLRKIFLQYGQTGKRKNFISLTLQIETKTIHSAFFLGRRKKGRRERERALRNQWEDEEGHEELMWGD